MTASTPIADPRDIVAQIYEAHLAGRSVVSAHRFGLQWAGSVYRAIQDSGSVGILLRLLNDERIRLVHHPNGFIRVTLAKAHGFSLRMHFWTDQAAQKEAKVHEHRWPFSGMVVVGGMTSDLYQEGGESVHSDAQSFEIIQLGDAAGGGQKSTNKKGRVYLRRISKYHTGVGQVHYCDFNVPHVVQTRTPTVSLVVTGPEIREFSYVYVDSNSVGTAKGLSRITDRQQVLELVGSVLSSVGRQKRG